MAPSQLIFAAMVAMITLVSGYLVIGAGANALDDQPTNQHLLTIHDGETTRGVLTKADTLDEALTQAGVKVSGADRLEPAASTKLIAGNYDVNIYRALPVTIKDGNEQHRIMSPYRAAKQIAANANVPLHTEDTTTITAADSTKGDAPGLVMQIHRATPFTLVLYGKSVEAYSQKKTVADMLTEKKIKLETDDTISVAKDTALTAGMTVEIWRNGVQTATQEEEIAFTTKQIQDANQPIGYKKVETPGKNGKKMVTYEITMKNGQQVDKKEIQSVVTEQATEQVEIVGAKMTNTFSGDFAGALARLRSCEGSYTSNTGNGYYGAYQYDIQTWGNYQGYPNAAAAPPAVQDQKVWETYQRRGWSPWPSCSRSQGLQDIYR